MPMNRNPYAVYGRCQRDGCLRPAVWKCERFNQPEVKLCDEHSDEFHRETVRALADRGVRPVSA